ncbi:MAG TPA: G1 family glutamic endopeptidase [Candidatus Saccharimonadales bacterium]|nr:G1 family glutamic endopeptidase [Candidatus Saccharimonadales bacterium]
MITLNTFEQFKRAFIVLAATSLYMALVLAGSSPAHGPIIKLRHGTSSNWSGYAASGAANSFTSVAASWRQPSVTCGSQTAYSSYWVGLDGYSSSTVEQLGTEADCSSGTARYSAWYEMYPKRSFPVTMVINPGDAMSASVTYRGSGDYLLSLADTTTGKTFTTTQKLGSARRTSAEVVVEAPWSGGTLPLANFGTASFTGAVANNQPLGGFSNLDPITMVNPYGMKATPSGFDATKRNFSIAWSAQ